MESVIIKVLCLSYLSVNLVYAQTYIDLTYPFNKQTPLWPGRKMSFNTEFEGETPNGIFIASRGFCISEHTSTHIDSPYHFNKNGWKLDEMPLNQLIDVPGVMIDIYDKVHRFEDGVLKIVQNYGMKKEDLIEWEKKNGEIPSGAVILVRTGFGNRWPNKYDYMGMERKEKEEKDDKPGLDMDAKVNFPGVSKEAAEYLAIEKQALGIGIDCASPDTGNSKALPVHLLFLGRNKYILENVANLHLLPPRGFNLLIVPFKVDQGTGAPARVLAKFK